MLLRVPSKLGLCTLAHVPSQLGLCTSAHVPCQLGLCTSAHASTSRLSLRRDLPPPIIPLRRVAATRAGASWLPCSLDNGAPLVAYAVDLLRLGAAGSATFARLAHATNTTGL